MKIFALIVFSFPFILSSCRKNGPADSAPDNTNYAVPTIYTPVNAKLVAYVYNNDQNTFPIDLRNNHAGYWYALNYRTDKPGFFSNGTVETDRYLHSLYFYPTLTAAGQKFRRYKAFAPYNERKNYMGVNYELLTGIGIIRNLGSETTVNLPGGGLLTFPHESMGMPGLDINYAFFAGYYSPYISGYALTMPGLNFADEKGTRKFLDSYGVYQFRSELYYCNCSVLTESDLVNKSLLLKMPIPAERMSVAPDSIDAWYLENNIRWVRSGVAYKNNGFYEKQINKRGVWNFAKPVNGVYIQVRLRTKNDCPIPNARYVIKTGGYEVAEGRTDADGNAMVVLPAGRPLTFTVISDHNIIQNNPDVDLPIGSFTKNGEKKAVFPDREDIVSLEGNVFKCDGSNFGNGSVIIDQWEAKDEYEVPIVNGKFYFANWITSRSAPTRLTFKDESGNTAFIYNSKISSSYTWSIKKLKEDFYACPEAPQLYCYYRIDSTEYAIKANLTQSSPKLILQGHPGYSDVFIQDGSKNISFSTWIGGGTIGSPVNINGKDLRLNPSGSTEIVTYRFDNSLNGIFEGWFNLDYLDDNNNPHVASGNFRLKIVY
jgi:hypothetical protein